ncbi:hypothetical protein B0T17DRAFT_203611 [Bombardia bombarda]|uniref:Uncharacterized protein n=1 Tax=Bombardia bombarda TaxID=252184 RepID=A0AA39X9R1_9PEZI|nr:hypothetical protein B0T17DRAFT_203611 [Bombardia bombarda]
MDRNNGGNIWEGREGNEAAGRVKSGLRETRRVKSKTERKPSKKRKDTTSMSQINSCCPIQVQASQSWKQPSLPETPFRFACIQRICDKYLHAIFQRHTTHASMTMSKPQNPRRREIPREASNDPQSEACEHHSRWVVVCPSQTLQETERFPRVHRSPIALPTLPHSSPYLPSRSCMHRAQYQRHGVRFVRWQKTQEIKSVVSCCTKPSKYINKTRFATYLPAYLPTA